MNNGKKTTVTVDAKSVDKLARLLGAFDENLNYLMRELGVVAYVEGVKIRVEGEDEPARLAVKTLTALLEIAEKGE